MANDRLFDPVAFMNEDAPANATRREPRPVGEPLAQVIALDWKSGTIRNGPRAGQPWYRCDAKLEVTDPDYISQCTANETGREMFTYGMMYDGDDSGRPKVGPNVNVNLGRFRDACGANGKPYAAVIGAQVRIRVDHKPHPTEPDVVLDEVTGLTRAG